VAAGADLKIRVLVKIEDRMHMIYLAFGGWSAMRMALTSISEKDFRNENWNWAEPNYISAPGQIHKNWVLFRKK
jgi:hypothetical protein